MLILLVACAVAALIVCALVLGLRFVPVRQALVVCGRRTGDVRQVASGPRVIFTLPLLERTIPLDLGFRQAHLQLTDLATSDCLAIEASLGLDFDLHPAFLVAADMNLILPVLPRASRVVEDLASYWLRATIAQFSTADLLTQTDMRARLEHRLHRVLSENLRWLGVRVIATRLLLRPAPTMMEAEMTAQAQARALLTLINSAGVDRELLAQILPLQLLRSQTDGAHLLANVNLPAGEAADGMAPTLHWVMDRH